MLHLDGSMGEGGGQVLRTALGLSLVTGQPFTIDRIRAGRDKPGLKRQHLTAVLAAAEIGGAHVVGAELGSQKLRFEPHHVRSGDHRFAIGTAGSTTLVLQTLLPALLTAAGPSTLTLSGGTHNPLAPSFDFLARVFAPVLRQMGVGVDLQLVRYGFAPAGGGTITASITPGGRLAPLELLARRVAGPRRARAVVAGVPRSVADRELRVVQHRLDLHPEQLVVEEVDAAGPGNILLLELPGEPVGELIAVPGERHVSAEEVAERACEQASRYLASDAPVGEHLADQLLIPLALAGSGAVRTLPPSLHTRTNADVVTRFLPVRFDLREDARTASWIVEVQPA
jgi:RNA 3'-terminal phosphate cyclase (ATP)